MPQHNWWEPGEWNACCDQCGFVFKSSKLSLQWNGLRTCWRCWEPRHPQDFVRGIPDDPSVPWSRPWSPNFLTGQNDNTLGGFVLGSIPLGGF